jgi:hypothetical protein
MLEIVANTRSGRALWAVTSPMIPAIRRMPFHQLSGLVRDKLRRLVEIRPPLFDLPITKYQHRR